MSLQLDYADDARRSGPMGEQILCDDSRTYWPAAGVLTVCPTRLPALLATLPAPATACETWGGTCTTRCECRRVAVRRRGAAAPGERFDEALWRWAPAADRPRPAPE